MSKKNNIDSVLVVGGGISGLQSSISLAEYGYKVYLLENSENVGGHTKKLFKTFPRTGCSLCALKDQSGVPSLGGETSKGFLITRPCQASGIKGKWHENIEILENSDLKEIQGKPGDFNVTITKNSQEETEEPYESSEATNDTNTIELKVGAIILSPGFREFNPSREERYNFENPNVLTSLQFEELLSNNKVLKPNDKQKPEKIAFIQCVGSRNTDNRYCSSVCCMYTAKQAINVKEFNRNIDVTIFYMDKRMYGKDYERLLQEAEDKHSVNYIKSSPPRINEDKNGTPTVLYEEKGETKEEKFDIVVLSTGLKPPKIAEDIKKTAGVKLDDYGFAETEIFSPLQTSRPGIFASGAFKSPKDVSEAVTEGMGAALKASEFLSVKEKTEKNQYPPQKNIADEKPRIGVFLCKTGGDKVLDMEKITSYITDIPNVVLAERERDLCSRKNREKIREKIEEKKLNRIVIAGCTPRIQESLFREMCQKSGLNPSLLEIANIREQCAWPHQNEPEKATEKAKRLIKISIDKTRLQKPVITSSNNVYSSCLVIGGGLSGIVACLELSNRGIRSFLVEKQEELGGKLREIENLLRENNNPKEKLQTLTNEVESDSNVQIFTGKNVKEIEGHVGNFQTELNDGSKLKHGAIIIATGAEESKPQEYLYGDDERVVTQLELEQKLEDLDPDTVVMIQCVGSRNDERPYCCRIGCTEAIKNALRVKKEKNSEVYVLYRDIQCYGLKESFYWKAQKKGVKFIRFDKENQPKVQREENKLKVKVKDSDLGKTVVLPTDLLVLTSAIIPSADNQKISKLLNTPLDEDGFFLERHKKLNPVESLRDGVFICGMAHYPKLVDESISQAYAAAEKASQLLSEDIINVEEMAASVDEESCGLCKTCISICPFNAVETKDEAARVLTPLCKGCGVCVAACPSGAIQQIGLEDRQITKMIKSSLE